jgi:hypothetical protein
MLDLKTSERLGREQYRDEKRRAGEEMQSVGMLNGQIDPELIRSGFFYTFFGPLY